LNAAYKNLGFFGVFSRRDPASVKTLTGASVYSLDDILDYVKEHKPDYFSSEQK
jgi:hypothetical protein